MATLYIGDLGMEAMESDIYDLFRGFDVRAVHMKFRYCFVTFVDTEQASLAIALDGTEMYQRRIRIEWARSSYDRRWDRASWGLEPEGSPINGNSIGSIQNIYPNVSNSALSLASSASSQSSDSTSRQLVTENTLLECEICFVRFDYIAHRPRSLPCGHSLCSLCITDTLRANQDSENPYLLCPFCRTSCGPHKTRVGQFPETFFILKMLEVEAEKAKKGSEKANEEFQEKEKEMKKKKEMEEKQREELIKEKEKKKQEEEYLKFQKQIGLDSTVSGMISCIDHLESLKDLHKSQLSIKAQLNTHRKKLLEEVGKTESEIKELSEQMFNIEVWIDSGKNLLTKFGNIQDNLKKDDKKENIGSCYDAAERCCLATQRWSEESLPEIHKMNLFIKQKQTGSSNGSMSPTGAASFDLSDQGTLVKYACTEGTDTVYKDGIEFVVKNKLNVITQMKEYLKFSLEELRVQYYLNRPCKFCNTSCFGFAQKCSNCSNDFVGATALDSQTKENKGIVELTEAMGKFNELSEISSIAGSTSSLSASESRRSFRSPRKILKRSKLGFLFEKTPEDVPDIGSELEISSEESATTLSVSSTGDNSTTESTTTTFAPFVVTNTSPSFNFGSTINPFQTFNLLGTTTAASSISLSSSVPATTTVASIAPLSAVEKRSKIGIATQLNSFVTTTSPSFNFGITINPFQTNLLSTTTAVSSMSLSSSVSAKSVASVTPLSSSEAISSTGSSSQSTFSVTSDMTNNSPCFNFGSTINPFQANLLGTTAVSSGSLSSSISSKSVASVVPLSASGSISSIGSTTQVTSSETNDGDFVTSLIHPAKAKRVANISQTSESSDLSLGIVCSVTNTFANMNNINSTENNTPTNSTSLNIISRSVKPLFSSCNTNTVSSPFSMGNLSHPSKYIPASVAEAAKQLTAEDFSFVSNSSESVRPKVHSACGLTAALTFESKSSIGSTNIARKTTFAEQKDSNSIAVSTSHGFRFVNSSTSLNIGANNITFPTSSFTNTTNTTTTTTTTTTTDSSTSNVTLVSAHKSLTLINSPSSLLPAENFGVRSVGTMTSDCSSSSPESTSTAAVALTTTAQTIEAAVTPVYTVYSPLVLSKESTDNKSAIEKSLSKASNCYKSTDSDGKVRVNWSTAFASVRPKIFSTISSQIPLSNTNSKYAATIIEDERGQNMDSKDCKLLTESTCDDGSTKSLPSFTYTMSPGKFSGRSLAPLTSTKTSTSDNAMTFTGLSFANSTHSTSSVPPTNSSFSLEPLSKPISFSLKPKTFQFS